MSASSTTAFSYQNFTNEQILDAGGRLIGAVLDPMNGVPVGDSVTRDIANDAASDLATIEFRLGLERKKAWTEEKRAAEKERDLCLSALRRGAREIQKDPDPTVTAAAREGGKLLQGLFAKRPAGFERKTSAENSGGLRLFFNDFDADAPQAALKETGLIRYYTLLKQAQATYERLIASIEAQEASAGTQPRLPSLREAKQKLIGICFLNPAATASPSARGWRGFSDTFGVRGWQKRWEADATLRKTAREHPAFAKWHAGLLAALQSQPLVALATEGSRQCYGKFRGDVETLQAMHGFMEEGGI